MRYIQISLNLCWYFVALLFVAHWTFYDELTSQVASEFERYAMKVLKFSGALRHFRTDSWASKFTPVNYIIKNNSNWVHTLNCWIGWILNCLLLSSNYHILERFPANKNSHRLVTILIIFLQILLVQWTSWELCLLMKFWLFFFWVQHSHSRNRAIEKPVGSCVSC